MSLAIQHIAAVVGEESVCLVEPILHAHELLVLRHQLGIVDEHGHQTVEAGHLLFVEVVFCHQGITFQNLSVRRTLPGGQAHGGAVQSSSLRD